MLLFIGTSTDTDIEQGETALSITTKDHHLPPTHTSRHRSSETKHESKSNIPSSDYNYRKIDPVFNKLLFSIVISNVTIPTVSELKTVNMG